MQNWMLGAKGFRPFFLGASLFATAVVPLWLAVFTGRTTVRGPLQGIAWHAHEMIHGFTVAVIAGFLLTAVSNWTKRPTATGGFLASLTALWAAGRVLPVMFGGWWAPALDLAFLPLLAVAIGRPIIATRNRRNYAFLVLLAALWATSVAAYLDAAGLLPGAATQAHRVAITLICVIILVVTGRIVPMFTRNGAQIQSPHNVVWLDRIAIGATAALAVAQLTPFPVVQGVLAGVAGLATLGRMVTWGTRRTLPHPLLWVLHLGHGSVSVGLCLLAASTWSMLPTSVALHTLTVGAIGLLTLGMMVRVSLGHTGRPLRVGWGVALSFLALAVAALTRVVVPWFWPGATLEALWIAATLWSAAFALYMVRFAPVLLTPRPDGQPG